MNHFLASRSRLRGRASGGGAASRRRRGQTPGQILDRWLWSITLTPTPTGWTHLGHLSAACWTHVAAIGGKVARITDSLRRGLFVWRPRWKPREISDRLGTSGCEKGQQLTPYAWCCAGLCLLNGLAATRRVRKPPGRFLRNQRSDRDRTDRRSEIAPADAGSQRRVLAIQDTTEINFSQHKRGKASFGTGGNGVDQAMYTECWWSMPTAASSWGCSMRSCGSDTVRSRGTRSGTTDEKESRRWLVSAEAAPPARGRRHLGHRRRRSRRRSLSCFCATTGQGRTAGPAQTDRVLADGGHLFSHSQPAGRRSVLSRPAGRSRPCRSRAQDGSAFWSGSARAAWPSNADRGLPKSVMLYALDVREIDPGGLSRSIGGSCPAPQSRPSAAVHQAIADYRRRWHIEQLFRTGQEPGARYRTKSNRNAARLAASCHRRVACRRTYSMQLVHARGGAIIGRSRQRLRRRRWQACARRAAFRFDFVRYRAPGS